MSDMSRRLRPRRAGAGAAVPPARPDLPQHRAGSRPAGAVPCGAERC